MEQQQQQHDAEHPEAALEPDKLWDQARADRTPNADEQAGEEHGSESTQEDALAGLPEPTRKLIEEIRSKSAEQEAALKDTQQKLAKAHGTIGNLTQRLNTSLKDLQTIKPTVEAVQKREADEVQAKEEREWAEKVARRKAAREKALEVHDEDTVNEMLPELPEKMPAKEAKPAAKPAAEEHTQAQSQGKTAEQKVARLEAEAAVAEAHPGWLKDVKSDGFKNWLKAQPGDVQALAQSDDPADAITMLDRFKEDTKQAAEAARLEAENKARLQRGETVQGRPTSASGRQPSSEDLWEQAKRDRAKARAA